MSVSPRPRYVAPHYTEAGKAGATARFGLSFLNCYASSLKIMRKKGAGDSRATGTTRISRTSIGRFLSGKSKKWRLISACLTAALGLSVLFAGQVGTEGLAAALADPLSILSSRSPGVRPFGALTQTKPARPRVLPTERVKSEVRTRPVAPGALAALPPFEAPKQLLGIPGPLDDTGDATQEGSGAQGPASFGDGGVPGGEPFFPSQNAGTVTPPIENSVPEPATWAMLIAGFFIIGASARSGRWTTLQRASLAHGDAEDRAPGALDPPA